MKTPQLQYRHQVKNRSSVYNNNESGSSLAPVSCALMGSSRMRMGRMHACIEGLMERRSAYPGENLEYCVLKLLLMTILRIEFLWINAKSKSKGQLTARAPFPLVGISDVEHV